jgi:hypothetical protein
MMSLWHDCAALSKTPFFCPWNALKRFWPRWVRPGSNASTGLEIRKSGPNSNGQEPRPLGPSTGSPARCFVRNNGTAPDSPSGPSIPFKTHDGPQEPKLRTDAEQAGKQKAGTMPGQFPKNPLSRFAGQGRSRAAPPGLNVQTCAIRGVSPRRRWPPGRRCQRP